MDFLPTTKLKKEIKRQQGVISGLQRYYDGAKSGRLTNDWITDSEVSADKIARWQLPTLRARSQDLARNNPYFQKYLNILEANVIGRDGVRLQMRVSEGKQQDTNANSQIEAAWKEWGKAENASVSETLSFWDLEQMAIRGCARDGEAIFRIVRNFGNDFRFAIQPLEADLLDIQYNDNLRNGHTIRMGVEMDEWGKPVSYHFLNRKVDEFQDKYKQNRQEIPAKDIIHLYKQERPTETRGIPWGVAAIMNLRQLAGMQEAILIQQRIAASKMGFFTSNAGLDYASEEVGNVQVTEASPGLFEQLPNGVDFKAFDVNGPDENYTPFIKSNLRAVAAALGVSYNSISSDLESVNFSSIRQGELEARDNYKVLQKFIYSKFHARIFAEWLPILLLTNKVNLPASKLSKFQAATWQPRGWTWVDPLKDVKASVAEVGAGFKSNSEVMAEQGRDFDDTLQQIATEKEKAKKLGLNLTSAGLISDDELEEEEDQSQGSNDDN